MKSVVQSGLRLLFVSAAFLCADSQAEEVRFGQDVLPILSDRCFHCHGPDESHRKAELRLDLREEATAERDGHAAIVPGAPDSSELLIRIDSTDPDLRMPPPHANRKPLTDKEADTLRRWIADGAPWGEHWSFKKPVRPDLPVDASTAEGLSPVDAFIRHQLQNEGLLHSPEADKRTLIRRVSFDLTGLPPAPAEVEEFVADSSSDSYEKLVDRLLQSPHFGERMAMWWLDASRYSDTDGFQSDATRTNWPWRDWVIAAFNENKPFDQFTIEQFAGDLLPNATVEQKLATCFHRNHMTNGEGGRDPEESRIDYVIDRVNTTGTVWLGLTLGCAQCHSHKFDPISHQDYYSLFAFFNSIDEDGSAGGGAKPYLKYKSPFAERALTEAQAVVDQRKPLADAVRKQAEMDFNDWLKDQIDSVKDGFRPWHSLTAESLQTVEGTILHQQPDAIIQASGPNPRQDDYRLIAHSPRSRITGLRLEVFPHESHTDGKLSRGARGEFILTDVKLQVRRQGESQLKDIEIASAVADAERDAKARNYGLIKDTLDDDPRNGWTTESHDSKVPHVAVFALAEPLTITDSDELVFVLLQRSTDGDANIGRFRVSVTDQPGPAVRSLQPMPLEELANLATASDSAEAISKTVELAEHKKLRDRLLDQFLTDHVAWQRARRDVDRANQQLAEVKKAAGDLNVMVLSERTEPRQTFVLERGVWDKKGAAVNHAVPSAILTLIDQKPQSRLDLARWLVDRNNPLTARVTVNHLWQMCFGSGLVRTPEDFGLQGEMPTHPEVLDWLAVELIESGWDLKHLLRIIVTSDTYRQSSRVTEALLQRDPDNRLLARGARFRLPSWMIRDAALQASGLLNPAIGGPPVMPYQPDGVWAELFMGRYGYEPSQGPAQHRRTLYAFWRRSAAPTFLFDSAQRRSCEVRPLQTNTPLHALTLLNDQSILESSRKLATSAMQETEPTKQRDFLCHAILSRLPTESEKTVLAREHQRALEYYSTEPAAAEHLLDFGQPEQHVSEAQTDVAALMIVASMILNLDEAITHE